MLKGVSFKRNICLDTLFPCGKGISYPSLRIFLEVPNILLQDELFLLNWGSLSKKFHISAFCSFDWSQLSSDGSHSIYLIQKIFSFGLIKAEGDACRVSKLYFALSTCCFITIMKFAPTSLETSNIDDRLKEGTHTKTQDLIFLVVVHLQTIHSIVSYCKRNM